MQEILTKKELLEILGYKFVQDEENNVTCFDSKGTKTFDINIELKLSYLFDQLDIVINSLFTPVYAVIAIRDNDTAYIYALYNDLNSLAFEHAWYNIYKKPDVYKGALVINIETLEIEAKYGDCTKL